MLFDSTRTVSQALSLHAQHTVMCHAGVCQYSPVGSFRKRQGFRVKIGSTIIDQKYCIKLCWHIYQTASQEAYSSVNRQLCHCLSMRFGHMRRTAHFLCNADKNGKEEGGECNGEETCVDRIKERWRHRISPADRPIRFLPGCSDRSGGGGGDGWQSVWVAFTQCERTLRNSGGIMMMSTRLMRVSYTRHRVATGKKLHSWVVTPLAYPDTWQLSNNTS